MTSTRTALATLGALAVTAQCPGQSVTYDFSPVEALAQGAVTGQNVVSPIPGFELMVMKDGRVVFDRAYGVWTLGRVANADSATKTISGAVILSACESSATQFGLNTTLVSLMPEFSGLKQGITIGQCFSHMSGLRNSDAVGSSTLTLRQAASQIASEPLQFIPGSTFAYGGTSMHGAGAAAEIATGQPWNALFAARIAGPLGMVATRFVLTTPTNPRIAGGCESNASEFGAFMEMLRRGGLHQGVRVLSEASVAQMFTRQTPLGVVVANSPLGGSADYGVGVWLDRRTPSGALIGAQAAGARGFSSWIDFDDGVVGVFATDLTTSGNVQPILDMIRSAVEVAVRAPIECEADFDGLNGVTIDDLFLYLNAYFTGDPRADFNGVGGVSIDDLFLFLNAWFTGC